VLVISGVPLGRLSFVGEIEIRDHFWNGLRRTENLDELIYNLGRGKAVLDTKSLQKGLLNKWILWERHLGTSPQDLMTYYWTDKNINEAYGR
jgi:hypothetical protein